MNFFEQQQRARSRTWLLTALFAAATLATVFLANVVGLAIVAFYTAGAGVTVSLASWVHAHPQAAFWTSFGTLALIGAASMYRMASLSAGGRAVAQELGGARVDGESADGPHRQLLNVVEEMAIAAGVPVPEVYVLEQEPGINAFAAGFTVSDAAIAVTRGALDVLTREELQGVVAHEFGHILNGDMRLNTRLLGVLYGILFVGLTGRIILRSLSRVRVSSRRGGGQFVLVAFLAGLALVVVGYVGLLFGSIIRAAVARQREFLADASAVQFTRNPQGIAGALKKIAASPLRAVLQAADGAEVSHMLIADGRKMFERFFATHPPILARIKAIDKHFDPAEIDHIRLPAPRPVAAAQGNATELPISPSLVVASIGTVARDRVVIPEALRRLAYSPVHAPSLALALALSRDATEQARQIARVKQRLPDGAVPHLDAVVSLVRELPPAQRLPLIEVALPALRRRPPAEINALVAAIEDAARADGRFDFLDYALIRLLRLHLFEAGSPQSVQGVPPKLYSVRNDVAVLLSLMAQAGNRDKFAARRAYEAGIGQLFGANGPAYETPEPWVAALDRALMRLDGLAPLDKQRLIEAIVVVVVHDRRISLGEVELLRAVCGSLHCPVPPLSVSETAAEETRGADTSKAAG
ncbi:MAG: M48 family metalloprotease [Sulfurifustaceae bacterium]